MGYTLVNPSAGNDYFNVAGTAVSATNQPRVLGSTIAGVLDDSIIADAANTTGFVSESPFEIYTGFDDTDIIRGMSNTIAGVDSTVIRSHGNIPPDKESIMKLDNLRVTRVATAIRNGEWNEYTGGFTSGVASYDDLPAMGTDDEANSSKSSPGAFSWAYGGTINQEDYPARTQ